MKVLLEKDCSSDDWRVGLFGGDDNELKSIRFRNKKKELY